MVIIEFPNKETEKKALGFLLGRFSGHVLKSGHHFLPDEAAKDLTDQGIAFSVNDNTEELLTQANFDPRMYELGHCGDVDMTQILQCLKLSPTERLRRHEEWRILVKEAVERAELRRKNNRKT